LAEKEVESLQVALADKDKVRELCNDGEAMAQQLMQQKMGKYQEDLRSKAKVE
jgi:hypothetical protein